MDLKEEKYITVLAECGNLTQAAEKLFISQPALSMFVKKVEKNLGVKLFDRTEKRFVPTYAGELYMKKAKAMLRLDQEFHAELNDLANNAMGELSMGIEGALSPFFLPMVLPAFRKKYPNVKLTIREGLHMSLEDMQKKHICTFYLMHLREPRSEFYCERITKDQLLMLIAKDNPLVAKLQKSPESKVYPYINLRDCQNETFILPTKIQNMRRQIDTILEQENIYPQEILEVRMFDCATNLAATNIGICFIREFYMRHALQCITEVVPCTFSTLQLRYNDIYLCYLKDHVLTEYEKYILKLLKNCCISTATASTSILD